MPYLKVDRSNNHHGALVFPAATAALGSVTTAMSLDRVWPHTRIDEHTSHGFGWRFGGAGDPLFIPAKNLTNRFSGLGRFSADQPYREFYLDPNRSSGPGCVIANPSVDFSSTACGFSKGNPNRAW